MFGETKLSMYLKYKSLVTSITITYGRLGWNECYRADAPPERRLDFEEQLCVAGALIAWSHDQVNQNVEVETCDAQRMHAEA